jgi:gas vesicle protein
MVFRVFTQIVKYLTIISKLSIIMKKLMSLLVAVAMIAFMTSCEEAAQAADQAASDTQEMVDEAVQAVEETVEEGVEAVEETVEEVVEQVEEAVEGE